MRIVVLGASGNAGTALLRRLSATQHDVVGVARRPPEPNGVYAGVEWHAADLAVPLDAPLAGAGAHRVPALLARLLAGADAVVDLVWGFQPSRDVAYLEARGPGLVRALLAAAPDGIHLVHSSSVGAYSPASTGQRVTEEHPTGGSVDFPYSQHKAAAERLLDAAESASPGRLTVTRVRPGLVLQGEAGSELLRYAAPSWLPGGALALAAVLPLDRRLLAPVVHADDLADAFVRILERRAPGAFNVATEPPLTRDLLAAALHARPVHVPRAVLRTVLDVAWRARMAPLDPGWLDLAYAVPLMDTTRAREELDWQPRLDGAAALADLLAGMRRDSGTASPALRRRAVGRETLRALRRGLPGDRRLT